MPKRSMRAAINDAIRLEMERDPNVVLIGEDVRGGAGGTGGEVEAYGGVMGVTKGLWTKFGSARVIDTPITESAIVGMAAGAAMTGLRPIAELMFMDFFGVCYDMLYNQAAKFRYMFGGHARTPLVVRGMMGAGFSAAAQHSQAPYNVFTAVAGLTVVVPSTPYDAKGLLITAIRDDDPVVFCEHKLLYGLSGEVPDEAYTIPFGEANYTREGEDVTIVALAAMVPRANAVADKLRKDGISVEVVDPRTTSPLDEEGILESVEHTGRLVVVDESAARAGIAHDIAALVASQGFHSLKAPIQLVTPPHTPIPFSPALEKAWLPDEARIEAAVRTAMAA
ncbi:MAG: alpha-ketoacid dehydrogenase subunit beta [Pseudomonadota bacterium]